MVKKCFLVAGPPANQEPVVYNNWYKALCSSCNFTNWRWKKLLKQLESGFKRTITWNEYQYKVTGKAQNRYLDFLIDPSFKGLNRLFVLFYYLKIKMFEKITNNK